ncbi:type VI secretion system contractile sheath large subunit [Sansalvadorimonas sp. 2012CJ34-2]|uniref:Type VI secretion system contractile sheath large subunit n=1 Tax=Parendozoicomonas callyspongiae TaxID=2942213 RepID=A0ABT0PBS7_9GAMM|nr:type VI secretion system contractile sheath large subunit [Sansalvadorimonas sp. 2012CJ34-2]MCL6268834.1 type VI secretion system contractile sheath large subunit [Sansalvadorimonas sp. 2012CJ34-2]
MVDPKESDASGSFTEVDPEREESLLNEILSSAEDSRLRRLTLARGQAGVEEVKSLFQVLASQALDGTVTWNRNLTDTIRDAVRKIDETVSNQLRKVYQADNFRDLEGRWLGFQKLVKESELGNDLKIKLMDISKDEILDQFDSAPAIDRSVFFNTIYQHEYGTAGGEPYSVMLADYYMGFGARDVNLMRYLGEVGAASHCPVITATKPDMFGLADFKGFAEGRPIASGFSSPAYASWNSLRDSNDAHYLVMTMPRVLARMPYGLDNPVSEFEFNEIKKKENNLYDLDSNRDFVWNNACYEFGLRMTEAYYKFGWCTAIRGMENGGKVENLPNFTYDSEAGDIIQQCPVEVNLTDEQEKELSDLGFLPLIHYKSRDFAVFIGAQTIQKPKRYTNPDATANAEISARLPYVMASSRIAHYMKVMGRDMIGSSMTPADVQTSLTNWLNIYTNANAVGNEARAKYPLSESKVSVIEQPGRPGCYSAVAYLKPWLQLEELTTSLRTVASIPG